MLHEQAAPAVASWSSSSAAQHFPTSVLLQEQRDEYKPFLHVHNKEVQILFIYQYQFHHPWVCLNAYNKDLFG